MYKVYKILYTFIPSTYYSIYLKILCISFLVKYVVGNNSNGVPKLVGGNFKYKQ